MGMCMGVYVCMCAWVMVMAMCMGVHVCVCACVYVGANACE